MAAVQKLPLDRPLDFSGCCVALKQIGVEYTRDGKPITAETLRSWADTKKLPFFKGPDGRRYIMESTLLGWWTQAQDSAIRAIRQNQPVRQRRRN